MNRPGPPPTPTKILKARGSWRARRNPAEPKPGAARPRCPGFIDHDARKQFKHLARELQTLGILARIDGNALARYCQLWSSWKKATQLLTKDGEYYTVTDADGNDIERPRPQLAQVRQLAAEMLRLENHFGMTPSARAGLHVTETNAVDDHKRQMLNIG